MIKALTLLFSLVLFIGLVESFTQNNLRLPARIVTHSGQTRKNQIVSKTRSFHVAVTSLAASEDSIDKDAEEEQEIESPEVELSGFAKIKQKLFPPKEEDGLSFKEKLAKAGLSVVLSYGWVSNVSYSIAVSIAWFIFSKQTGLSPLAPGQWPKFLAVYAGFFVFNNIVRPIRFGISCGVSLYFDRLVQKIQDKFRVKKGVAIFLTVFFANVLGTIALMCSGIYMASLAAGVPVFVK